MNPEKNISLIDQVTADLDGFIAAGLEENCEEAIFTLQGMEVTDHGTTEQGS